MREGGREGGREEGSEEGVRERGRRERERDNGSHLSLPLLSSCHSPQSTWW